MDLNPSSDLLQTLAELLSKHCGHRIRIHQTSPISGGSINDAWRVDTDRGNYFLKTNRADRYPSFFTAEADGLERLRATRSLRIPELIGHGEVNDDTYLLMEFITGGRHTIPFWEGFGRALANLHRNSSDRFGLERDNYIGSLKQTNTWHVSWSDFFIHCRLEPQLRMARDAKRVDAGMSFRFERLFGKLEDLFPQEAPALLHGDLWSGNYMADEQGRPVLFDPAVHYGHREMDLAMSRLFSGFDPAFYDAYRSEWPLMSDWERRSDLCNLYPLLVHVNLFGGSYVAQVERTLRQFT